MHPFLITPDRRSVLSTSGSGEEKRLRGEEPFPHSAGHQPCTEKENLRPALALTMAKQRTDKHFLAQGTLRDGPWRKRRKGIFNGRRPAGILRSRSMDEDQNFPRGIGRILQPRRQGTSCRPKELVELRQGRVYYGGPECYFEQRAERSSCSGLEYGGDGGKKVWASATKRQGPVAFLSWHIGRPTDVKIILGTGLFPKGYSGRRLSRRYTAPGKNRAPWHTQGPGYNVVTSRPLRAGREKSRRPPISSCRCWPAPVGSPGRQRCIPSLGFWQLRPGVWRAWFISRTNVHGRKNLAG